MKDIVGIIAVVVACVAGIWGAVELSYRLTAAYSPKMEEVRRDTFEQSRAFREGTVRDIENLRLEYMRGTPEHKSALRSVILHRMAGLPVDTLTPELRNFKNELERSF